MGISLVSTGDFKNAERFFKRVKDGSYLSGLSRFGKAGVTALSSATPRDTGETAQSWDYRIIKDKNNPGIEWINTNVNNGVNVAIILQYGHGTGTGGYVVGYDYINPAIRPIFDKIAEDVWKEVNKS